MEIICSKLLTNRLMTYSFSASVTQKVNKHFHVVRYYWHHPVDPLYLKWRTIDVLEITRTISITGHSKLLKHQ